MTTSARFLCTFALASSIAAKAFPNIPVSDPNIVFSPFNWFQSGSGFAQTSNPGAYLKVGFTGTSIAVRVDESALTSANVPATQYPVVRFSVDGRPGKMLQLSPSTTMVQAAAGLPSGRHTLLLEYVSGYVFLDFWTPVNAVRIAGLAVDPGASWIRPFGPAEPRKLRALFLGDSITNGDDDVATYVKGITNEVDTQDATLGYPAVVAAGIGAEYGIVAYGGASWDGNAADGHTPGLMLFNSMLDSVHSRLVGGKFSEVPDDIFINMGENAGPSGDDVPKLLAALRAASGARTNIFVIIPFSGRSRSPLLAGFKAYQSVAKADSRTYLIDLGNNPYLTASGPTLFSVDGQHPLASLHAMLGAQIVQARASLLIGPLR